MSDKNTTYTVYIDGTLTEGQVISDVSYYDSTTYKASGINLKGLNGLDGQGRPKDSISCNYNAQNPGIALQVETNPDESYISKLNIYNLRISGGYNTDSQKAAGICSVRNTDVNLYYGTEISNNTGGAWYGYYLYIKGSVYIPSGESGTNDLRFYSDSWSKIKINTIRDKHNSEDRIRLTPYPDHYTAGHRIIEKDDNSSPDIDVSKFSVTPNTDEDGNTINWHLKSVYDNYGADLEQD